MIVRKACFVVLDAEMMSGNGKDGFPKMMRKAAKENIELGELELKKKPKKPRY